MRSPDDDLDGFIDDPLVRALTGPATSDELAGEEQVLAAFHARPTGVPHRRFARRIGLGGSAVIVALGLSGGVAAAAYTSELPEPVQRVAHGLLGFAGVPAPAPAHGTLAGGRHHHVHTMTHLRSGGGPTVPFPTVATGGGSTTTGSAHPAVHPSASPAPHGQTPAAHPAPSPSSSPVPVTTPTPAPPSPTPAPSPSPTSQYGDPASWTVTAAVMHPHVLVGHGEQLTGRLTTSDGRPVAGHHVFAFEHVAGSPGWQRHAIRKTGDDGTVVFGTGLLDHTTVFVLRVGHGVHSAPIRVIVIPTLTPSLSPTADGKSYLVDVPTNGGDPGDTLVLLRRQNGRLVQIASAQLDGNAHAAFIIHRPLKRQVHYLLRLRPTRRHGLGQQPFVVQPG
ncbi:MAG: hypothetical protein JO222_11825 [Frankiales bacterium]|nr:hypothetical protein [Frankiales bacterium]